MVNYKKILRFEIYSFIFIGVLGALLHFVYNWSGNNSIVASFSAINESTWEHLKILFLPTIIAYIIGYFFIGKENSNFWCASALDIAVSLISIIVLFYVYQGILGANIDIINIFIFYVAIFLGKLVSYRVLISNNFECNKNLSISFILILALCFIVFTYKTPEIGLFKDPISGKYGFIE